MCVGVCASIRVCVCLYVSVSVCVSVLCASVSVLSVCVCMPACDFVHAHVPVHLCLCVSNRASVFAHLYVYESVHLCLPVCLWCLVCFCEHNYACAHASVCVSLYVSVCICVSVSLCAPVCVCVHLHVPQELFSSRLLPHDGTQFPPETKPSQQHKVNFFMPPENTAGLGEATLDTRGDYWPHEGSKAGTCLGRDLGDPTLDAQTHSYVGELPPQLSRLFTWLPESSDGEQVWVGASRGNSCSLGDPCSQGTCPIPVPPSSTPAAHGHLPAGAPPSTRPS